MFASLLLPAVAGLRVLEVKFEGERFNVEAETTEKTALCPGCQVASHRIHSQYRRKLADLPWAGCPVELVIKIRRFRCQNAECGRRIFCERLTPAIAAYARQTVRLQQQLEMLALAMGGELTARVLPKLGLTGAAATLLVRLRHVPDPPRQPIRVLGLDDWAKRKGQDYGTILIDLERGCVVDLLPDRKTATVVAWLQAHPEIEIISRDRFVNDIEAATQGAPSAIQVADRFHLVKNLHDALRRMLDRHTADLRRAAELVAEQPAVIATPNPTLDEPEQVQTDSVPTAPEATVTPVATDTSESALLAERFAAVKAVFCKINTDQVGREITTKSRPPQAAFGTMTGTGGRGDEDGGRLRSNPARILHRAVEHPGNPTQVGV